MVHYFKTYSCKQQIYIHEQKLAFKYMRGELRDPEERGISFEYWEEKP
jgi:hypothetical protein